MGWRLSTLAWSLGFAVALPVAAGSGDLSVVASVASDYVFRGVSQSDGGPALQLGVSYQHTSGFFGGLWGSTVDFPEGDPRADAGDVEVDAYLGYGIDLGPHVSLVGSVLRYEYPGATSGSDYASTELGLAVGYDDLLRGTLTYTDDVYGSGRRGMTFEMVARRDLTRRVAIEAGVGYSDLDDLESAYPPYYETYHPSYPEEAPASLGGADPSYTYWHLGVGVGWRRLDAEVGYYDTSGGAEGLWGDRADARVVASLSWRLW